MMSCLKCRTCYGAAPAAAAASVGVILVRAGGSEGSRAGVTAQLTHVAKRSKSPPAANGPISPLRRLIERMDLFLRRGTLAGVGGGIRGMTVLLCGVAH